MDENFLLVTIVYFEILILRRHFYGTNRSLYKVIIKIRLWSGSLSLITRGVLVLTDRHSSWREANVFKCRFLPKKSMNSLQLHATPKPFSFLFNVANRTLNCCLFGRVGWNRRFLFTPKVIQQKIRVWVNSLHWLWDREINAKYHELCICIGVLLDWGSTTNLGGQLCDRKIDVFVTMIVVEIFRVKFKRGFWQKLVFLRTFSSFGGVKFLLLCSIEI